MPISAIGIGTVLGVSKFQINKRNRLKPGNSNTIDVAVAVVQLVSIAPISKLNQPTSAARVFLK